MSTPAAADAGPAAIHAPTDDELLLAQRRAAMRRSQKGGVTPDARALALLQESLVRGRWRDHHLNALAADGRTAVWLGGLIECTRNAYEQREQALALAPKAQAAALKKAQGRNVICLGSAVCPDETKCRCASTKPGSKSRPSRSRTSVRSPINSRAPLSVPT